MIRSKAALCLAVAMAALPVSGALSQQAAPAAPNPFPPGPEFVGVAGSAAESERLEKLCGVANRNAKDGYFKAPVTPDQTRAPILNGKSAFTVEVFSKIDRSIGMAFLPGGGMIVSQRTGGMRIIDAKGAVSAPLNGTPKAQAPATIFFTTDIQLDKDFRKNRTLYYGYITRIQGQGDTGHLIKGQLSADQTSLDNITTIYEGPTFSPRRLAQLRDGTLLVTSAESASNGPNPQSLQSGLGKIYRLNTDGSAPKDNPFVKDAKAIPALYALGFRDIQSLALDPRTGKPWVVENAAMGGDELNVIKAGANYGFPVITYGRENNGSIINGGKTVQAGMEQPVYFWNPDIAPSGMAFYDGKAFPQWKGDIFVGGMSSRQLVRLQMKNGRVVAEEKLLMDRCKRIKDVRTGPDGLLYVMTDETPSEILRLSPPKK